MKEQHDLAKWLEGKMTEGERLAFERTPEFADYDKIRTYSQLLQAPDFDTDAMYEKVVAEPKVIPIKPNWLLRIAAVLVIGLGLFFATRALTTQTQTAENGDTQIFELPDASQVTLNSGSEIQYNKWSWNSHRSLQLDGEAFFKVTKGKTFDVCTDLGKVTVLGTQFNVKARGKRFEVVCFEGKVRVQSGQTTTLLTPGMHIALENGQPIASADFGGATPSWMQEQISFNAENLDAVIAELERQYDIAITKQNIKTDLKFTGTIPANNLDVALQIIGSAYNFKHSKTGKNSITFIGK
jgi:transmembrane sensor